MFLIRYSFHLFVCLMAGYCADCHQRTVSIYPVNPWYWLDSYIKITCKTTLNITIDECSWFVNGQRICKEQKQCSITLLAATSVSGKWKCRLHPSSEVAGLPDISASTNVTILKLSQRECIVIVCCAIIVLTMTLIIVVLVIKHRKTLTEQRNLFVPSAPVSSDEESFSENGTLPPSYDAVINDGILANELDQSEFSRFHNETEGQRQQGDPESIFPKTRSAPNLI